MSRTRSVAKSITLRRGFRTWEVRPGKPFRIGRHPANDMVISDLRASRFHAEITWADGGALIKDCHSVNGTFLDGLRLRGEERLPGNHRILIGRMQIEVEHSDGSAAILEDSSDEVALFSEFGTPILEGVFTRQSRLHKLLLDLEWEERTGTLELSLGVRRAKLTFSVGRVVAATHQQKRGLLALEKILHASVGGYRFTSLLEPSEENLDLSVRNYMREGYWGAATRRHLRLID